jgi:importin-9
VPAPLKILKVLVVELTAAAGSGRSLDGAAAAAAADLVEDDSENDDWEDEPNPFLDMSSGMTKEQLMAFAQEDPGSYARQRDDETQTFLVEWFRKAAGSVGFETEFQSLTEDEREKLRRTMM